ncbi:Glucose-methanol-choline oxidoreductase, C-terminal [Senna tora]|uniref:Glucose-methanol-choline oxidoreductase, C-terminal n=1 Tax=Senna tora TaxID=362788 RepID=A0A834XDS2_9FABA|nr:Glucose-methanol-choline oxidoreductase, C-terminal [Senna tora]
MLNVTDIFPFLNPTHSEVRNLDLIARVDQEIRRLDVTVNDVAAVEKDLDFCVVIVHIVTLDDVLIIHVAEDLDFAMDLSANGLLVMTVDNLERENPTCRSVDDFIHGAATSASDSVEPFELGERDELMNRTGLLTRRRRRVRWGKRKRHRSLLVTRRQR